MNEKEKTIIDITEMSKRMRKKVLDMALSAGSDSSHFGGGLSMASIIVLSSMSAGSSEYKS